MVFPQLGHTGLSIDDGLTIKRIANYIMKDKSGDTIYRRMKNVTTILIFPITEDTRLISKALLISPFKIKT